MSTTDPKLQWEQAVDAVIKLGVPVTIDDVWKELKKERPEISRGTIGADLNAASVNSPSRTSYGHGKEARRTDTGNSYDRLLKLGAGRDARFVPYEPEEHGVWEIYPDPSATSTHKTSVRMVSDAGFNAQVAMDYLERRYPSTYSGTSHIAAYRNRLGRELAFDPGKDPSAKAVLQIFIEARPPHLSADRVTEYPPDKTRNHHLRNHAPTLSFGERAYSVRVASLPDLDDLCKWYDSRSLDQMPEARVSKSVTTTQPVNKILFGPPGTGKTYQTVNEALRILDPEFLAANEAKRVALKQRFDALAQAGLIRFVTFHQSFSYEDFVEGIRASADETTGGLCYEVEDGVFKLLCEAARSRTVAETGSGIDIANRRIWKISLGDANTEGHIFDECMAEGFALLGFGAGADLTGVTSRAEIVERLRAAGEQVNSTDYAVTALDLFVRRVQSGDLVVVTQGNLKFRAIGEVTGDYIHVDRDGMGTYSQGRPVRWLRQYDPARPYADLMENRFSQMTIYELRPGSISLQRLAALLAPEQAEAREPEARVLIIDEINRGNVSRVFGELITEVPQFIARFSKVCAAERFAGRAAARFCCVKAP